MRTLTLITLVAAGWFGCAAAGETTPVPPAQVIQELIVAVQANDLNGFAHRLDCGKVALGPHGRSTEDTVAFLRTIKLDTAEILGASTPVAPAAGRERIVLRTPTEEFRFDLELRETKTVLDGTAYSHREITAMPHYVVTEIHQHP